MKILRLASLAFLLALQAHAARLANIVEFTPPPGWKQVDPGITDPRINPDLTIKFVPEDGRHSEVLLTLFMAHTPGIAVTDRASLQRFAMLAATPYLPTPTSKPPFHDLKVADGMGLYVVNEDPNLVGEPVPPGEFRAAGTAVLFLAGKFVVHGTILFDEANSPAFRQARDLIESAKVRAAILAAIAREKGAAAAAASEEQGIIARPGLAAALHLPPNRYVASPMRLNRDPGYFIYTAGDINLSGWLDHATRFTDMKTFWAREKASLVKNTGADIRGEMFKTVAGWEVVLYSETIEGMVQKNGRACRVVGDTWADLHLSSVDPAMSWSDLEAAIAELRLEAKK